MKKITLLFFILTASFGFSQSLPMDFEDPADDNWGPFNGASATVVDSGGGDMALELTSVGVDFDGASIGLAAAFDMSDDGNNTMTFTFHPQAGPMAGETRTHLLKLEGGAGGPATAELFFDSVGDSEQPISVDFGAGLGTFNRITIFADSGAGNTATGTYWIDDIDGGTPVGASCTDGILNGDETNIDCGGSCPNSCPPNPPRPNTPDGEVVLSLINDLPGYSNQYGAEGEFGVRSVETFGMEDDEVTRMDFSVDAWGQFNNTTVDVQAANFLNLSYYVPNLPPGSEGHEFYIMIASGSGDKFYTFKTDNTADDVIVFDSWQNVSIPMTHFTSQGFNDATFLVWKLGTPSAAFTTIVYFDNIYFSVNEGTTLSTESISLDAEFNIYPNPTQNVWNVKANNQNINSIQLLDMQGRQVLTIEPNATEAIIDASSLPAGMYFARIDTPNGSQSMKLIKQ